MKILLGDRAKTTRVKKYMTIDIEMRAGPHDDPQRAVRLLLWKEDAASGRKNRYETQGSKLRG